MLEETIKTIVKEAVRESIQEEIKNVITYKEPNSNEEVMTTIQLAVFLQCSVPWLTKNIKELNIPVKKISKEYRFLRTEIIEWIKSQEQNKQAHHKGIVSFKTTKNNDFKII